uniref:Protein farnesyltransferase/geranylgeranyltransferase type-1 subunit alpha n=2 Tax=Aceria tosichella TaxID=561515 RepID=A0A6G1S563_9ACAR
MIPTMNINIIEDMDDMDDDSTSRSSSPDFISYRTRPEWADVEPISIKSQSSVMDIKYTPRFEEAFSYFRAMLVRDELSERSLALTADCIELQRSNFSVWYFRRRILRKLTHHLENELEFVGKMIEDEPKNYQVWHHRKTIVEWLKDGSQDKQLTASVLSVDSKNYHAWQHRQWVIKEFSLWEGELEFTDAQIAMDVQNNSAWNHRYFVVTETKRFEDPEWLAEEIRYVHKRIEQSPNNESTWSYLRGILTLTSNSIASHSETNKFCETLQHDRNCRSPHLLAFVLDSIREQLSRSVHVQDRDSLKSKACDLCDTLSKTDQIRSRYWKYIKLKVEGL